MDQSLPSVTSSTCQTGLKPVLLSISFSLSYVWQLIIINWFIVYRETLLSQFTEVERERFSEGDISCLNITLLYEVYWLIQVEHPSRPLDHPYSNTESVSIETRPTRGLVRWGSRLRCWYVVILLVVSPLTILVS